MSTASDVSQVESGDEDLQYRVSELKRNIFERVSQIKGTGSFAVSHSCSNFVLPGIVVSEVGQIRVPLSTHDAQSLVQAARKAPFGKGNQTLVDETVRKTWEIDGSKVSFSNEAWSGWLQDVVETVAQDLGVAGGPQSVRAELYKMLLYEEGAMFKAHQDTEKTPGMFGTLVICLPSTHTGGTVRLSHVQKEKLYETATNSEYNITYIAWYADVTHEIEPVQSGYRWVLVYNLIQTACEIPQTAARHIVEVSSLAESLLGWRMTDTTDALCYALGHQYTAAALRMATLKGEDYIQTRFLADAGEKTGEFEILLASMEKIVTLADDERTSELWLNNIVDLEGYILQSETKIPKDFLLQDWLYRSRDPDEHAGGEYQGNQHADVQETYRDTVVVLVPKVWLPDFLLGRNYDPRILRNVLRHLQASFEKRDKNQAVRDRLVQICRAPLKRTYFNYEDKDLFLGPAALGAIAIADMDLFRDISHATKRGFDATTFSRLGELTSFPVSKIPPVEDVVEAFSRITEFHRLCECLQAFQATCSRGIRKGSGVSNLQNLVKDRMSHAFVSMEVASEKDIDALIKFVNECDEHFFNEYVKPFIARFTGRPEFSNKLTLKVIISIQDPSKSETITARLLPLVLGIVVPQFKLAEWSSAPCWLGDLKAEYITYEQAGRDAKNIARFHQHLFESSPTDATMLLAMIQSQLQTASVEAIAWLTIVLLKEMIPIVDQCPLEAGQFYTTLLTSFVQKFVQQEPERPADWAQPKKAEYFDVNRYNGCRRCSSCPVLQEFFLDPTEESCAFTEPLDLPHLQSRIKCYHGLCQASLDESQSPPVLTLTKIAEDHAAWKERASKAQESFAKLPQDALKQALGDDYDAITNLDMVRLGTTSSAAAAAQAGDGGEKRGVKRPRSRS